MTSDNGETSGPDPRDIVILYIEDEPFFAEVFAEIRAQWSPESCHARSLDSARKLIESPEFTPHFAIHDCRILTYEEEGTLPNEGAGSKLYFSMKEAGIPVLVLTGESLDEVRERFPYRDDPPELGYISKPPTKERLQEAVRRYLMEYLPSKSRERNL